VSSEPSLVGRVVAPLISPNEPEAQVVEIGVEQYSPISRGDVVCVLETSKSAVDVESEYDGHTGAIELRVGDRVTAGQLICEVFDRAPAPTAGEPSAEARGGSAAPAGLKLTRSAERLAREAGIDLSLLPTGRFVTERDVEALIASSHEEAELDESLAAAVHENAVVVFGAGGHAKSLIDLVRSSTPYEAICVVDDHPAAGEVLGVPVVGSGFLTPLRGRGVRYAVNAVGAIGRIQARIDVGRRLSESGFELPVLADRTAFVAGSATLAEGVQVFAGAAVCSASEIGPSVIVNTGAIVSHDCRIGEFSHLAPGAILAGEVEVGEAVLVGMGVTVNIGVRIGARAIIGNGCVLNADVPENTIVTAGTVWPR
jgi:sugar O-acyltransferase (sialic acid O-acetyltransferase NeuD family)